MKRKTSTTPTRVYRYGCFAPTIGLEAVEEQLKLAHRYRNMRVEIERERRARRRKLDESLDTVAPLAAEVARLEQAILDVDVSIKECRSKKLTFTAERQKKAELVAAIKVARLRKKEAQASQKAALKLAGEVREKIRAEHAPKRPATAVLRAAVKEAVEAKYPEMLAWLLERTLIDDELSTKLKTYRAEHGPYWGTYLLLDESAERAAQSGDEPKFKPYTGEGLLGCQIQHGMTVSELFSGTDTRLRVVKPPDDAWEGSRGAQRKKYLTTVHFRIGSEDGAKPKWAVLPLIMHRPLPADAVIKWARLHRTKDGPATLLTRRGKRVPLWKWEVHFVIEAPSFAVETRTDGGTCAFDLGWRSASNGVPLESLLVASWRDSRGGSGRVHVPKDLVGRLEYAEGLRSTAEGNMNAMREFLAVWRDENKAALPEWLAAELETVRLWRSATRFFRVRGMWESKQLDGERFENDSVSLDWMPPWRKSAVKDNKPVLGVPLSVLPKAQPLLEWLREWQMQHEHLWRWESRQRRKALLYRREQYRVAAKSFATNYRRIVVRAIDLSDLATLPAPEEAPQSEGGYQRRNRTHAAPSEFRSALKAAAAKYGAEFVELTAVDASRTCPSCQHLNTWTDEQRKQTAMQTCEKCGTKFDFDLSAAEQLLKMAG